MTDIKSLTTSLFQSESTLAKIVFKRSDLKIIAVNSTAERLYCYSAESLVNKSILILSDEVEATLKVIDDLNISVSSPIQRHRHKRADGTVFYANIGYDYCTYNGEGVVCKYVQDATNSVMTERELIESQEKFRAVANYTYDWESWLNEQGDLVWVNPAVERLTGYTVEDCLTMPNYPLAMVHPDDHSIVHGILDTATDGNAGNDIEFRVKTKQGTLKWFAASWQSLKDQRGTKSGFRMSIRDIEDRKRMEDALRHHSIQLEELANRRAQTILDLEQKKSHMQKLAALGEMAASIAHEVNNPIAGMKNAIRLVLDTPNISNSSHELLTCVDREIDRIASLMRQINRLCRPTISQPTPLYLPQLIQEIIQSVESQCNSKQIVTNVSGFERIKEVWTCEPELRQILHNLILNAYEASEENQLVEIGNASSNESELAIRIRDHGSGIDVSAESHIFEPFFTTKRDSRRPGTGLGLAISRSLAMALGGKLELENPGQPGASFLLRLPLVHRTQIDSANMKERIQ